MKKKAVFGRLGDAEVDAAFRCNNLSMFPPFFSLYLRFHHMNKLPTTGLCLRPLPNLKLTFMYVLRAPCDSPTSYSSSYRVVRPG